MKKDIDVHRGPGVVNLILHGLFVLVEQPGSMQILIPRVQGHAYRAGAFLAESALPETTLEDPIVLLNVNTGGAARLDRKKNLVFDTWIDAQPSKHLLFASILTPVPDQIISERQLLSAYKADGAQKRLVDGKKASQTLVLRFEAKDLRQVFLWGHPTTLVTHKAGEGHFLNIHFFADEERRLPDSHPIDAFQQAIQLLPEIAGQVRLVRIPPTASPGKVELSAAGYAPFELLTSLERAEGLARAGIAWRDGAAVKPLDLDDHAHNAPQNCVPFAVNLNHQTIPNKPPHGDLRGNMFVRAGFQFPVA